MSHRVGRAVLAVTACVIAAVPGLAPGAAASSAGWHVIYYVPNGTYTMQLGSITAPTTADAWATGTTASLQELQTSYYSPLYHWNGTSWTATATSGPLHQYNVGGISATASNNVLVAGYGVTLRWNGSAWTVFKTAPPATADIPGVLAVGSGAWVPGKGDNYWWTGTAWKAYPVYGQITQLWGTNPASIWGAGLAPDGITAEIVHWNGTAWKVTKFFRLAPPGTSVTQVSVAVDSGTSWAAPGTL